MIDCSNGPHLLQLNVSDLSASGIGLLASETAMKCDQEFLLLFSQGSQHSPRAMLCRGKRCNQLSKQLFSIGALFLHELSYEKIASRFRMVQLRAAASVAPLRPVPKSRMAIFPSTAETSAVGGFASPLLAA
jgi:hypothetical protein